MTDEELRRTTHAAELLKNELLNEILDGMERDAVVAISYAAAPDHDFRQAKAVELRTVRELRQHLKTLATIGPKGRANPLA